MWPFTKTERRDFTQITSDRAVAAALGNSALADVTGTAAAAIAMGIMGRTFAAAEVSPSVERTGLSPPVLAQIGASLISAGESVWLIDVDGGMVRLLRASSWMISGTGPDPANWKYLLTLPGPTQISTVNVPSDGVLHPRINMGPQSPHQGRSPLALAGFTATALAGAERQLSEELSGPVGRLIPAPLDALSAVRDDGTSPLSDLESALASLKGRSALVPSLQRDALSGGGQPTDWRSVRIGADPPESVVTLRSDSHNAVLSACGIPPALFSAGSQANSAREALRQFLHTGVAPNARVIEAEARDKLMADVSLDFTGLHAADIQGRARSFKSLVDGGMSLSDAAAASGILIADEN